jgi:type VI secretion system secreted protein Hcp
MAMYMNYEGIDGSVTAKGYEKWVELHSFQFGVSRGITTPTGRAANREAGGPQITEIVVTKVQDGASARLYQEAVSGTGDKVVKIDLVKTDKGKFEAYLQYVLENTIISSFNFSSSGDRPLEALSLNFTKITYHTTQMDSANKTGKPDRGMWDLVESKSG